MTEPTTGLEFRATRFEDLDGWPADDHAAAFRAYRRGAAVLDEYPPKSRATGVPAEAIAACLAHAAAMPAEISAGSARAFFEAEFAPFEIAPGRGFFTGYYEPVVAGSRTRTARFGTPLYGVPDDLVELDPRTPASEGEPAVRFARKAETGFEPYPDRAAIEAGYLVGRGLELAFVADAVDAFFIHIQGSARIRLPDGRTMRVTYAAKSGHSYTPIGRVLIEIGALAPGAVTMAAIRAWLAAHPDEAGAVMARNRSFIFFREAPVDEPELGPIAAGKAQLTPGRSLAVDRLLHSFHLPVWVETTLPASGSGRKFNRLMVAQDTGSAIVGPARGDIFFGSGEEAGALAGAMRAAGRFILLIPRTAKVRA